MKPRLMGRLTSSDDDDNDDVVIATSPERLEKEGQIPSSAIIFLPFPKKIGEDWSGRS